MLPARLPVGSHCALDKLEYLDLTQNSIGRGMPSEIGLLTVLGKYYCCYRAVSSTSLSSHFVASPDDLILDQNMMLGTLPSELGACASLKTLSLQSNRFSGPIPSELGQLNELNEIVVVGNNLFGTIPVEVCDRKAPNGALTSLAATYCQNPPTTTLCIQPSCFG